MWRPIDYVADWLRHRLGARAQLRAGILLVAIGLVWTAAALTLSSEPPNVVAMSGAALVLAGLTIVIGAEVLEQGQTSDTDDHPSD